MPHRFARNPSRPRSVQCSSYADDDRVTGVGIPMGSRCLKGNDVVATTPLHLRSDGLPTP